MITSVKAGRNFLVILLVIFLAVFAIFSKSICQSNNQEVPDKQLKKFVQVYDVIKTNYVKEVPPEEVFANALKGMLRGLDPYSEYFTAQEYEEFTASIKGEFAGVGLEISVEDGFPLVVTPLEDTPAFRAGLLAGDRILEIDGASCEGLSVLESSRLIKGKPDSKVTFTVLHKGDTAPVKITVTREIIKLKSVKQAKMIDEPNKIGYLRITNFQDDTLKSFEDALQKLQAAGLKSLIVDLRFNGGGIVDPSVAIANKFITQGVIVTIKGRAKEHDQEFKADPKKAALSGMPLVLLVNGGTASASEIFAGAIQDYSKGLLIGSRTYGKGSVQTVLELPDDKSAVKLTIARYYTPSGKCLQRDKDKNYGLDPNITVEMTPQQEAELIKSRVNEEVIPPVEPPQKFVDIQLQKALEVLTAKK